MASQEGGAHLAGLKSFMRFALRNLHRNKKLEIISSPDRNWTQCRGWVGASVVDSKK